MYLLGPSCVICTQPLNQELLGLSGICHFLVVYLLCVYSVSQFALEGPSRTDRISRHVEVTLVLHVYMANTARGLCQLKTWDR